MNPARTHPGRQRGVALITAVLIVSIAVIAATAVLDAGHFAIQRTSTLQDSARAWGYASGAEDWVRTVLERDAEDNDYDALDDAWATPQSLPVENGVIQGRITDATAQYNLNNLGLADDSTNLGTSGQPDTEFQRQVRLFARLIENIEGGTSLIPDPLVLAQSIRDWIDADQNPTGSGREDNDYLSLDPPRRAANRPMASVTELRSVLDAMYDARSDDARKVYRLLLPHVTALPVDGVTPINVNTATPELLMALSAKPGGNARLREFSELREEQPLENPAQISEKLELIGGDADPSMLTVSTRLFRLQLEAVVGNGRVALYSLIYRSDRGTPVVLVRSTDTE
ncbi:type II secretion system minor pseudopilin GspK [Panacagrimonas sp.]|uniref:type II secretion system minor pseudopilin GspK n=1 Tax=Panacagrimonas sp. TaxID=2480088 RepID=UPI003B51BB68